jgi:hypothetical protein
MRQVAPAKRRVGPAWQRLPSAAGSDRNGHQDRCGTGRGEERIHPVAELRGPLSNPGAPVDWRILRGIRLGLARFVRGHPHHQAVARAALPSGGPVEHCRQTGPWRRNVVAGVNHANPPELLGQYRPIPGPRQHDCLCALRTPPPDLTFHPVSNPSSPPRSVLASINNPMAAARAGSVRHPGVDDGAEGRRGGRSRPRMDARSARRSRGGVRRAPRRARHRSAAGPPDPSHRAPPARVRAPSARHQQLHGGATRLASARGARRHPQHPPSMGPAPHLWRAAARGAVSLSPKARGPCSGHRRDHGARQPVGLRVLPLGARRYRSGACGRNLGHGLGALASSVARRTRRRGCDRLGGGHRPSREAHVCARGRSHRRCRHHSPLRLPPRVHFGYSPQ